MNTCISEGEPASVPAAKSPKPRRIFKVLAIDGGGIRGLYSARLLAGLEARTGKRAVEHFDLICGTSTGGLIALALAMGHTAHDIAVLYKHHGAKIFTPLPAVWLTRNRVFASLQTRFPASLRWLGSLSQLLGGGKYSNTTFREVLTDLFGEKRIGDAECLLCITSYSLNNGRPYVIKFDHTEGRLGRDNALLCVDAALATSAAPTYFPVTTVGAQKLVDGGVYANNPAIIGVLEAFDHFVGDDKAFDCVSVLSIETPGAANREVVGGRLKRGVFHWRENLINLFTQGQAHLADRVMRRLSASPSIPCEYTRLEAPTLSHSQGRLLTLDNASPRALLELETLGADAADRYSVHPKVQEFFSTLRTYHLPTSKKE